MSDDKSKRGTQDRDRINVHEDYELRGWAKKIGVTQAEINKAVRKVGTSDRSHEKASGQ
jgi:hypothetical protein